jgi:hypothetical protein
MGLGIGDAGAEVSAIAISLAHALGIFLKLAGVIGAGKEILEEDGFGNADGAQVSHRLTQYA